MVWLGGQFGLILCLALLTLFIKMDKGYAAIACILAYEVVINATIGPVHWVYLPEVLNDSQFGFICTVHYLNAVEIALATEWMIDVFSPAGVFLLYTVITSFGFVFMWFMVRETQGLADWQKKQIFMPKKYQKNQYIELDPISPTKFSLELET